MLLKGNVMNRIQTLLLLIIGINTASPAGLVRERRVEELAKWALLIENTKGADAATVFIAGVNGETFQEAQERKKALDIMFAHTGPGLKEHRIVRKYERITGLRSSKKPEEEIMEYMRKNDGQPPSRRWLNEHLWESDKLWLRTLALKIIKQHSLKSEIAAKYLADYKKAKETDQPMGRFKPLLNEIVTYMENNKGQAPSKDLLDEYLRR